MHAPAPSPYITDVAYPSHFHREMTPVWLTATLTGIGRHAPDLRQPFKYLELGCGSGLNLLVAAACHPGGHFEGIDLSAREIRQAQDIAAHAGLDNIAFSCEDLQASAARQHQADTADCDFVVCHGVYSWVDLATRQAIHRIIAHRLKPGGVAYLAYMSQPGSASFAAAQKLMWLNATRLSGPSAAKARDSLNLVRALAKGGAGYFVEHGNAQREIERMHGMDDAYLAHELLNSEWHAHHVADVMRDMHSAGCDYAGSATPIENIDAISLPSGVQPVLAKLRQLGASLAEQETAKDIARNQNLRRDLYQKRPLAGTSGPLLSPDQHRRALLSQQVARLPAADRDMPGQGQTTLTLATRIGPVELPAAHTLPLLGALESGPATYATLARLPAHASNPGAINPLLQTLAWAGWLHFQSPNADNRQSSEHVLDRIARLRQAWPPGTSKDPATDAGVLATTLAVATVASHR